MRFPDQVPNLVAKGCQQEVMLDSVEQPWIPETNPKNNNQWKNSDPLTRTGGRPSGGNDGWIPRGWVEGLPSYEVGSASHSSPVGEVALVVVVILPGLGAMFASLALGVLVGLGVGLGAVVAESFWIR